MKTDNKKILYCIVHNSNNKVVFVTDNSARMVAFVVAHFPLKSYEFTDLDFISLKSKNFTMSIVELDDDYYSIEN